MTALFPLPLNELDRLVRLQTMQILDTANEPQFDAIARLGCRLLDVPICVISLLDRDRQWFKSVEGLGATETPRDLAFCNYPVAMDQLFVVPDTTADKRFSGNPLVTGSPDIRFYAGYPIAIEPGVNLGAVCVLDRKPRDFSEADGACLRDLADLTIMLLKQHQQALRSAEIAAEQRTLAVMLERQSKALAVQNRLWNQASTIANIGAWEFDVRTGAMSWTPGMYALFDLDPGVKLNPNDILGLYPAAARRRLQQLVADSEASQKGYEFEDNVATAKCREIRIKLSAGVDVEDGVVIRRFGIMRDITDHYLLAEQTRHLARFDAVTDLNNRHVFQQQIDELTARGDNATTDLAVFLVDLDNFKDINDTYGHAAGDACLQHIARRMKGICRNANVVARIGGDEFGIVFDMPVDRQGLIDIAERLLAAIRIPIRWQQRKLRSTGSIGIATRLRNGHPFTTVDILREADLALYETKSAGRNDFRFFAAEYRRVAEARVATVSDVRRALVGRQLELSYQPKVRLADRVPYGFEALVRWRKPNGSLVSPTSFKAALEDFELSREIGEFVIKTALDQAAQWSDRGISFGHIAVNLSASQLNDESFAEDLIAGIEARKLDPQQIQVEVTEGVFLSSSSSAVRSALYTLKAGGISIALDDFGTGYASLTHLRHFPVDIIKIDQTFVKRVSTQVKDAAIVQAIIVLSRSLSLDVVAEGVETEDCREALQDFGCRFGQGYLFAKPLQASEATRYLIDAVDQSRHKARQGAR